MTGSMFDHSEDLETKLPAELAEAEPQVQKALSIVQLRQESGKHKYVIIVNDHIVDCVDGYEALVQEMLTAFDELTPEAELGAATF